MSKIIIENEENRADIFCPDLICDISALKIIFLTLQFKNDFNPKKFISFVIGLKINIKQSLFLI
ncbi:hypothetical protein AAV96_01680 [Acinetobacter sp. AG1]|nr:hypothetical protein AAV96_01680 [Acinetobacter sp. AG1]